jgi:ribosomal protein S18 acetylase RimI-like enzyme
MRGLGVVWVSNESPEIMSDIDLGKEPSAGFQSLRILPAIPHAGTHRMLVTAPNILRNGRGHGYLDNVATHPEFRGQGHGRAVVEAALAEAWARDCHHVLLQSGREDPRVHRFYKGCGFEAGVRVGYDAGRPT